MYINIIKAIYGKPIAISYSMVKCWKPFLLRSGMLIQHSTWGHSQRNQTRQRNKRHPNWKGGNKTVIVCRWHYTLYRKSQRLHHKTIRNNKWLQKGCRIQNQYTEICCISIDLNFVTSNMTKLRKQSQV